MTVPGFARWVVSASIVAFALTCVYGKGSGKLSSTRNDTFFYVSNWIPRSVGSDLTPGSIDWFDKASSNAVVTVETNFFPVGEWRVWASRLPDEDEWYRIGEGHEEDVSPWYDQVVGAWCVTNSVEDWDIVTNVWPSHVAGDSISTNISGWFSSYDYGAPVGVATNIYKAERDGEWREQVVTNWYASGKLPHGRITANDIAAMTAAFNAWYEREFYIYESLSGSRTDLREWYPAETHFHYFHPQTNATHYAITNRVVETLRLVDFDNLDRMASSIRKSFGFLEDVRYYNNATNKFGSPYRDKTKLFTSTGREGFSVMFPDFDWTDDPTGEVDDWDSVCRGFDSVYCAPIYTNGTANLVESIAYGCFNDFKDPDIADFMEDIRYQSGVDSHGEELTLSNVVYDAYRIVDTDGSPFTDGVTNNTRRLHPSGIAAIDQVLGLIDMSYTSAPDIFDGWMMRRAYTNEIEVVSGPYDAMVTVTNEGSVTRVTFDTIRNPVTSWEFHAQTNFVTVTSNATNKIAVRSSGVGTNSNFVAYGSVDLAGPAYYYDFGIFEENFTEERVTLPEGRCVLHLNASNFGLGGSGGTIYFTGYYTEQGSEERHEVAFVDDMLCFPKEFGSYNRQCSFLVYVKTARGIVVEKPDIEIDGVAYSNLLGEAGYACAPGRLGMASFKARKNRIACISNMFAVTYPYYGYGEFPGYEDAVEYDDKTMYMERERLHKSSVKEFRNQTERVQAINLMREDGVDVASEIAYGESPYAHIGISVDDFANVKIGEVFQADTLVEPWDVELDFTVDWYGASHYIDGDVMIYDRLSGERRPMVEEYINAYAMCGMRPTGDSKITYAYGLQPCATDIFGHVVTEVLWNWDSLKLDTAK